MHLHKFRLFIFNAQRDKIYLGDKMNSKYIEKYRQLGLNIAYYRKLRNLNQEQLAEKIGKSRTHISNIEAPNVIKSLSLDVLLDISEALNIPVEKLFELR